MENQNQELEVSLKPEELTALASKVQQGQPLDVQEAEKLVRALPNLKKTVDGLYSRATKAEEESEKLKGELAKAVPPQTPPPQPIAFDSSVIETKVDLRMQGYEPDIIAEIEAYAKGKGIPLAEAARSSFIQEAITARKAKKQVEQATPSSSNRTSNIIENKSWEDLTPDERNKNIKTAWEKRLGGANRSNE